MSAYSMHIYGYEGDQKIFDYEKYSCVGQLPYFLETNEDVDRLCYKFKTNLSQDFIQIYLEKISKLWFIGDYLHDIPKIAKEKEVWFNLKKINGFRFYSVMSLVRYMENFPQILRRLDFSEVVDRRDNIGHTFLSFLCSTEPRSTHAHSDLSIFDYSLDDTVKSYKYSGLIKEPEDKPMFDTRTYRNENNREIKLYWQASNTK